MMNSNIRNFFLLIGSSIFLLIIAILTMAYWIKSTSYKLSAVESDRYQMIVYADVLRQSSDDLSKFARLYVVSGNKTYKDTYYNILDIRNGAKKRPLNYQNVYWDIMEPERSNRHPLQNKKALSEILKGLAYDKTEYKNLQEAENNSNELSNLEIEAFNAMVGLYKDENGNYSRYGEKDQQKAIELLHSDEYMKAKEKVMLPIDKFLTNLQQRTEAAVSGLEKELKTYTEILLLFLLLFLILFGAILYITRKKILKPILYLSDAIHSYKNFRTSEIEEKIFYDDEIGLMSKKFYEMRDEINKDIKIRSINEKKISEYVLLVDKNIITSSTDLAGRITYISEAFCNISGYSKEELLGKKHSIVKHSDMPSSLYEELWSTITKDKIWRGEIKNKIKDGDFYWVDATIYPIYDENNKKIGYTAIRVDITDRKKVEKLLVDSKLSEKKIKDYVSLVDKNILTSSTDLAGKITYASEAFCRISGYSKEELLGQRHSIVKHQDTPTHIYDELWESITNNRTWHGELKNRTKNGNFYWVDASIYPIFDEKNEKIGYTAIRIDITDKKRVEELLITDGLTGIYNRRFFNESLPRAINTAKRDKKYFSFFMMDIDHFKQYNDTYGHQEGDHVLIEVAKAIKSSLKRSSDMCFRLGGEEFGIIFESLDPIEAYNIANTIRENVQNLKIAHKKSSTSEYVTISIGLVTKKSTENLIDDEIYKEADNYLYKAKESGRNRVEANMK